MQKVFDFVLVGGGAAGVSAAETLRRDGATGSVLLVSNETQLPYLHTHLSKQFLLGALPKERLPVHQAAYYREHNIDLMLGVRGLGIETRHRILRSSDGDIEFGKLLIATGAQPIHTSVPGSQLGGVHYLHTLEDAEALRTAANRAKRAVVLGGSFLGIEVATTLARMGIHVTLIEERQLLMSQLAAPELSEFFSRYCREHGLDVRTDDTLVEIRGYRKVQEVHTQKGNTLACDLVVIAIGVRPSIEFLNGSGIAVGDGILVDHHLETNIPGIFAAGDAANFVDTITSARRRLEHWDNAVKQGRLAARNMLGQRLTYDDVSYFFCNILDLSFNVLGSTSQFDECVGRGSLKEHSFALFYLKDNVLRGAFSMERPAGETFAAERFIRDRVDLKPIRAQLPDPAAALENIATQTVLVLPGGGALGAFEVGVLRALEEAGIQPNVVAGVSIGAFNGAIIASHPGKAAAALEAFWSDLTLLTPLAPNEEWRRTLSSWQSAWLGSPHLFVPRWLEKAPFPWMWTSLYDTAPARHLLEKYVDLPALRRSPVRLLISAVNIETSELQVFDSHSDDINIDHILASGSLPGAFPWTDIGGQHFWDAGIVSNSPLEMVIERCGEASRRVFLVDLFHGPYALPKDLTEVMMRRDEIVYAQRVRNDVRLRERIGEFRDLVEGIMDYVAPEDRQRLRHMPRFIELMASVGPTTITRIINQVPRGEPQFADSDFSAPTIQRHIKAGYDQTKAALRA